MAYLINYAKKIKKERTIMTKKTDYPTPKPLTQKTEPTQEEEVTELEHLFKLIRETDIPNDFLSPENRDQGQQE